MTKAEANKIHIAGQKMSNFLYNLGQSDEFKKYSQMMREMVKEWDDNKLPLAITAVGKKRMKEMIGKA